MSNNNRDLQKLVYLGMNLMEKAPQIPRNLQRFIPQFEIVDAARLGLEGASQSLGIPTSQLKEMYHIGKDLEDWEIPSPYSYRMAASRVILSYLEDQELPLDKQLEIMGSVAAFMKSGNNMIMGEEFNLGTIPDFPDIEKFETGFEPLDLVLQGMYQGLVMLMAQPGTGKTSTMISIAECMKRKYPQARLKFFQQEIPGPLFLARMKPVKIRGNPFTDGDMVYTAKSLAEILEIIMEDPSNDQIIFIDSPDAMSGPGAAAVDGGRRFDLENIYRQLVAVKSKTRCIFVASQPRKTEGPLKMNSPAESYAKTWYSDIIIGFWGVGAGKIKMVGLKNRFGPANREVVYHYDYITLAASDATLTEDDWDFNRGQSMDEEEGEY